MKKIFDFLFSSKLTIVLLILLAIVLGTATFIEDKFDTSTAKLFVYNAKWFEILFILLAINFIGHISRYKMLSKAKLPGFVFHFAFVLMILGAGVTRYFSFEGNMHIREGEASNQITLSSASVIAKTNVNNQEVTAEVPAMFSPVSNNSFEMKLTDNVIIKYNNYIKNAVEKVSENVAGGTSMLELMVFTRTGRSSVHLNSGEVKQLEGLTIAYNNNNSGGIKINDDNNNLTIIAPFDMFLADMQEEQISDTIKKDSLVLFDKNFSYNTTTAAFVLINKYKNAKIEMVSGDPEQSKTDALLLDVTVNNKKETVTVLGGSDFEANMQPFTINGQNIYVGYGCKVVSIPFSLKLNDFILDRYPGSMSPSSYASEVTLIDNRSNLVENHRIFMNNVLDYDKYRFFQSSYDQDERGTILSVNHDFWGTWISYLGYLLLAVGFVLTLFNKNSRFFALIKLFVDSSKKRKSAVLTVVLLMSVSFLSFSQNNNIKPADKEQVEKFGHLLVQTFDGRFEPLNSMAYDVLHKISRKDNFDIENKGNLDAMQAFMDIIYEPDFWKEQKIIYVREKSVQDAIGIKDKYASFKDFFDEKMQYKLQNFVDEAFRKKQAEQNTFDKEIIKVDERVNILMMVLKGNVLKIFPLQNSPENKWISYDDPMAIAPLGGSLKIINDDLKLQNFSYTGILNEYITQLYAGNYTTTDKILTYLKNIQRSTTIADQLPTDSKINLEIFYNKNQIFILLRNIYGGLSIILLLLAFIDTLKSKKSKILNYSFNALMAIIALGFVLHTVGMGLRWYLTGHAPWSNGYEALLLVSWGSLLAGFIFVKYSKITFAIATLLSFLTLMTASHSSYDPQLTNLQPVLKSYWLIIHVATLTISYCFLGIGFFIGLFNLFIMIFKNNRNKTKLSMIISELTYVNEMNLIVGLVFATIGTFLGGVWANESWGRYWGWDAKETWALIIVIAYSVILHLRFIPKLKSAYVFNLSSIIGFGSVLMTFIGVNYYFSKGLHSYAHGETPVFPLWAWITILSVLAIMIIAGIKEKVNNK